MSASEPVSDSEAPDSYRDELPTLPFAKVAEQDEPETVPDAFAALRALAESKSASPDRDAAAESFLTHPVAPLLTPSSSLPPPVERPASISPQPGPRWLRVGTTIAAVLAFAGGGEIARRVMKAPPAHSVAAEAVRAPERPATPTELALPGSPPQQPVAPATGATDTVPPGNQKAPKGTSATPSHVRRRAVVGTRPAPEPKRYRPYSI